jgi:hypothetical protein
MQKCLSGDDCQIDVPDESMSIMESKFDPTHKMTTAYLVSLPQEVKDLMLEEGEIYVPSEGYSEVRLGIFDATADGQIVINESDMFKSGNDLAAAGDVRSSTATGPSFNPSEKEQASVVIIYRMSTWQLGRSYKLGQLQAQKQRQSRKPSTRRLPPSHSR